MRDGLRVAVRLQPGARANAVGGLTRLASGAVALKARVERWLAETGPRVEL